MNRVRRAAQSWMRHALAGGRSAALLAGAAILSLAFSSSAVAQSDAIYFGGSVYDENANQPFSVDLFTELMGSPGGGVGTLTFDTSACSTPPTITGPATPNAGGNTSYQFVFPNAVDCPITASWDPDDGGTRPAVTDTAQFQISAFNIIITQQPSGPTTPYSAAPVFSVTLRDGTAPVAGAYVEWAVAGPMGSPQYYGSRCVPSAYSTDAAGRSTYSFADIPQQALDQFGTYTITVTPNDGSDCAVGAAASAKSGAGAKNVLAAYPSQTFNLQNEDVELVFVSPPTEIATAATVGFPVQLRSTSTLTGIAGQTVSWNISPSTIAAPISGSLVTDASGNGTISLTGGTPDLMGGFLGATVPVPLPSPNDQRAASTNFTVIDYDLTLSTAAPTSPTFSEEQAVGFAVLATTYSGNTVDPAGGVPITFSITSGNGTFASGSTTDVVTTDSGGIAFGPSVVMGRTSGPVVVQADGGIFGSISQNYSVQPSTYTLAPSGTPPSQDIMLGDGAPLSVRLERGGSSTPMPLDSDSVTWQISPDDGSTVSPSPTTTDSSGVASATFFPAAGGTYVVTARFATGFTSDPAQAFTINVTAPVKTLTAVSGDGQAGDPGTTLPNPLVVQAFDDGSPPSSSSVIEWSASGGALLTGSSPTTPMATLSELADSNGRSQVQVSLPATPGTFTITATRLQSGPMSPPVPGASVTFTVSSTPEPSATLRAIEGNGQQGLVGQPGAPLAAQLDIDGAAAGAGVLVRWSVVEGDATLTSSSSSTDANGVARTGLVFGANAAESLIRAASLRGSEAFFRVFATADGSLSIVSGDAQVGPPNGLLAKDLVVQARAPAGGVLDGVEVTWTVGSGGGSVSSAMTRTDSSGRARVQFTLGSAAGTQEVTASLASGASVTFRASAEGASRGLSMVRGNLQRGLVFTRTDPLEVRLNDDEGKPIVGATILWEAEGDAQLDAPNTTTGSDGATSNLVTFGASAGAVLVRARAAGVPAPVEFTLESELPAVTTTTGDGQSGVVNQPLAAPLSVVVGLPPAKGLDGVQVQWQVLTGGGSLASATTTSDVQGRASNDWTLGGLVGEQSVQATLPGGQTVVFRANAGTDTGAVSALRLVSGTPQNLPTNTPSAPLVVEVVNADGQPVGGVALEWSTDTRFASLRETSNRTGSDGRADNIAQLSIPGAVSVSVRVADSDIPALSFQLTGGVAQIPGLSEREREAGRAIDNACPALAAMPSRTPEQEDLFQRCSELVGNAGDNPQEVRQALGQLPADVGSTMSGQGTQSVTTQFDNLDLRLHVIRGEKVGSQRSQFNIGMWTPDGTLPLSFLPSAFMAAGAAEDSQAGLDFDRWGFFATGQIGRGEVKAGSRSPQFDYDIAGLTFGVDYRFSDQLVAGVALGYSDNDAELAGGRGDVATKGWNLSGYATWYTASSWYVDGTVMVGSLDYDLQRRVRYAITAPDGSRTQVDQLATASTDGDLFGTSISLGRDWQKGPWSLGSYLRGQFSRVKSDAFVERMLANQPGQGLALAVDARTTESVTSVLGGRATYVLSRDWGILMPNLTVEWEHEFEDDPSRLTARLAFDPTRSVIEQFGDPTDSDYFNVGVGVSALFPGGRSAYLYYEELVGASRVSQGLLSLGVRFEF